MKKNVYLQYFLLTVVIGVVNNGYASQFVNNVSVKILTNITKVKETQTDSVWRRHREKLIEDIQAAVSNTESYTTAYLNDVQIQISNFVRLAVETGRADWMIDLMALYLLPYDHLQTVDKYTYYYKSNYTQKPLDRQFKMWLSTPTKEIKFEWENILDISQFLYPVSLLMVEAKRNPLIRNHPIAIEFVDKYLPVVFKDHYLRWIFSKDTSLSEVEGVFQSDGWGCMDEHGKSHGNYSGQKRIEYLIDKKFGKSTDSPLYCNAVQDKDLFIIAGAIHILALQHENPELFSEEDQTDLGNLRDYVDLGIKLFGSGKSCENSEMSESRLTWCTITNFQSEQVAVVNWDLGAWKGHSSYDYSAYDTPCFPGETDPTKKSYHKWDCHKKETTAWAEDFGYDLSHARRLVRLLFTLDRYNTELNLIDQVYLDDMHRGMANQLAYGVFDGNFEDPYFTNYLDGTVGWYRVNYNGLNSGYSPYNWEDGGGGHSFLEGGYMFWSRYNSDLIAISIAAVNKRRDALEEGCNSGESEKRKNCYTLLQIAASIPVEYYD